jgi:hypothetical protein
VTRRVFGLEFADERDTQRNLLLIPHQRSSRIDNFAQFWFARDEGRSLSAGFLIVKLVASEFPQAVGLWMSLFPEQPPRLSISRARPSLTSSG